VPGALSAAAGNQSVTLNWTGSDPFYNVYRSSTSGGPYTRITANVLTNTTFTDVSVTNGSPYFYVVTGLSILGEESGYSSEAGVRPVSTSPAQLSFNSSNNTILFTWPSDHTGWELQVQTNPPGVGLGTNWIIVAGSSLTNNVAVPVDATQGSVFYRLVYP
jgi:hypothetical protein